MIPGLLGVPLRDQGFESLIINLNLEGLGRVGDSRYFGKVEPIKLGLFRLQNLLQKGKLTERQGTGLLNPGWGNTQVGSLPTFSAYIQIV